MNLLLEVNALLGEALALDGRESTFSLDAREKADPRIADRILAARTRRVLVEELGEEEKLRRLINQYAPGADDDASGIATLTEVLRVAMASGWRPRRTVKFMGYAAEEVGLRGSNAIARAYRAQNRQVVAVLQMDMTNYNASAGVDMRLSTDYSNPALQTFLLRLFDTYLAPRGMTRGYDTCGYACSDHASWTAAGYPSAYFFEAGAPNGSYFPYIHTGNDTLANMGDSAQHSAKFAMLGLAFLGEAAKTTGP